MRSRASLFAPLFTIVLFALPLAAHAAIPFFGPIIDPSWTVSGPNGATQCPLGWGAIITVINNIIELLLTIAIVFIAPVMIAYSGFLFVVNPVNPSGKENAKKILQNTILGIVIALAGWLIVDAVMAVLYNPATVGSTWSSLITSGDALTCLPQEGVGTGLNQSTNGTPGVTVVPGACSIPALSPITDPLAQQMEAMNGNAVIWTNTNPQLQACANKFIRTVGGGTVTSAYRPPAYQTHLFEIRDRWCTQGLQSSSDSTCSSLKSAVSAEVAKHFGSSWSCGAVAATNSSHSSGTGVDISGVNQAKATPTVLSQSCLSPGGYAGDPWHYNLVAGCSCQ